jgi:G3E family GTPase
MHRDPAIDEFGANALMNLFDAALKAWSHSADVRAQGDGCFACEVHDSSGYVIQICRVDATDGTLSGWCYGPPDMPPEVMPRVASLGAVLSAVRMELQANFRPHAVVMGNAPPDTDGGQRSDPVPGQVDESPGDIGRQRLTDEADEEKGADLAKAVPVHVLTGFLGSGKTTLLNRLIRAPNLSNSAVVVNEFGDIGVDHLLVSHGEAESANDGARLALVGGCLCCELRDGLALTLVDLLARRQRGQCPAFERIIVETTGLADPLPILNLLAVDPRLAERTIAGNVLTVVDAVNGMRTLESFPEATAQVVVADHVIVSKTDLAKDLAMEPDEAQEQHDLARRSTTLVQRLSGMNSHAMLHETGVGDVADLSDLFVRNARAAPFGTADLHTHPHTHSHTANIHTFTIDRNRALPGAALTLFVQALVAQLGPDLLRMKGFVQLVESADQALLLQGAQCVFHPLVPVDVAGQADESLSRLVFIVRASSRDAVLGFAERLLDSLVWEAGETSKRLRQLPSHSRQVAAAGSI